MKVLLNNKLIYELLLTKLSITRVSVLFVAVAVPSQAKYKALLVNFRSKIYSNFLFTIFQKTIQMQMIQGQTSTKYMPIWVFFVTRVPPYSSRLIDQNGLFMVSFIFWSRYVFILLYFSRLIKANSFPSLLP